MVKVEYDYEGFDPEANDYNNYNPPEGEHEIKVISAEAIKQGIVLEFLNKGDDKTYTVLYQTNNDNADTRKYAAGDLGRIYFAATGRKPSPTGLDTDDMINRAFSANVKHTHYNGKVYNKLNYIKSLDVVEQAPAATQVKTFNKPSW
ncbi:MAG: hypothetical protein ACKO96_04965 [Flammeovirgaceae bacterium]